MRHVGQLIRRVDDLRQERIVFNKKDRLFL
jgi:hypothetical protein